LTLTKRSAGLFQHALDVLHHIAELRLKTVGQRAFFVKAWNARNEDKLARARGEGERRGLDAGGWRKMLDGGHESPMKSAMN
jgi:hypothetical protein